MQSDSKCRRVDKLMHPFMGPWRIVRSLPGASHQLEFPTATNQKYKKHTFNLFPYPPELIPFEPLDGADNQYSQLCKPFGPSPYKDASITGFNPLQPFVVASHFAHQGDFQNFHFPTLPKLNDKFTLFPWANNDKPIRFLSHDEVEEDPVLYQGLPPLPTVYSPPVVLSIGAALEISLRKKSFQTLFFLTANL
jgi:hypothetical protein